ncbi:MAG: hypothetical protein ACMUIG_01155 [Thermoplasmatota archaeon]
MPQDMSDLLEKIFRARGFEIETSSRENRYLLMTRDGMKRSVGYSPLDSEITEGEAEMYLSMAENDGSDEILFISPGKIRAKVKRIFKEGSAAVWDRTALSMAAGEMLLDDLNPDTSPEKTPAREGSIMDLFQTDDVNPVTELREYERELRSLDDFDEDGFSIRKVTLPDDDTLEEWDSNDEIPISIQSEKTHAAVEKGSAPNRSDEAMKHRVPDEVLLGKMEIPPPEPEPVFEGLPMMPMEPLTETVEERSESPPDDPWKDWIMAPERITKEKAMAISGSGEGTEVERGYRPHRLFWVRFNVRARNGSREMDKEGTYLVDLKHGEALSVPFSVADELSRVGDPVKVDSLPGNLNRGSIGDGRARGLLESVIKRDPHSEDEIVHDGTMSTVYEEVKYDVLPESIEVLRSMDVLFPYWVNSIDGKENWSVDAHLGRFVRSR